MRLPLILSLYALSAITTFAINPTATRYSWEDCQGSAKPYPVPGHSVEYPDTLTPVMINHVGRHGARYPAGPSHSTVLIKALRQAKDLGSITDTGRDLLKIAERVNDLSRNRWGTLDSLGMAEQCGIAARMYATYPELFRGHSVTAISSYVPRCIMSMYEFTHRLALLDHKVEISAGSGQRYTPLLRFFSINPEYKAVVKGDSVRAALSSFDINNIPLQPLKRVLGESYPMDDTYIYTVALAEYSTLAGLQAMGIECDISPYFTPEEYNALWSAFNLKQYLTHSASTISSIPATIASPLLADIISSLESFIASPEGKPTVVLRFGHAETLMPLFALMRIKGCYYLTHNFDTVGLHWRDFDIVPMAANLQLILFRSDSGNYYLRTDLNETPVPLIPGSDSLYTPWPLALRYLVDCMPLY